MPAAAVDARRRRRSGDGRVAAAARGGAGRRIIHRARSPARPPRRLANRRGAHRASSGPARLYGNAGSLLGGVPAPTANGTASIRSRPHRRYHWLLGGFAGFPGGVRGRRPRGHGAARLSTLSAHPRRARVRARRHRDDRVGAVVAHRRGLARAASRSRAQRHHPGLACQSNRHHDDRRGAGGAYPLRAGGRHRRDLRRNLSRPRLCLCRRDRRPLFAGCHRRQLVLQIFLHDRMADRVDGGSAGAGADGRALAAESGDLRTHAVPNRGSTFDGRPKARRCASRLSGQRRILLDGLPGAGLDTFLPPDGAFYLYADVSRFSNDSFTFATRMLEEGGVAATPGIDFDPVHGKNFLRLCYAGAGAEMREAVGRIGDWLRKGAF